jgi:hypothetical protein
MNESKKSSGRSACDAGISALRLVVIAIWACVAVRRRAFAYQTKDGGLNTDVIINCKMVVLSVVTEARWHSFSREIYDDLLTFLGTIQ